ncbi:Hsp70 family protein [Clostridium felsineum]|uniref:Chaperone protein DnaK n=1 Tax=Clostridium felsineum TaxID=36839 RepID=A0A1S8LVM1_9CLOT|nr:Hsp70 family protein [Clostridium felsineum]URZ05087.1 Chaperone protein DnaK [Clostridium felsineum]URZ10128.1 Chaperone protein DnaK [Clostridium felsineum]
MKYSLGIDLGTTFSVVSIIDENGTPKVLNNKEGNTLTPSVIYFGNDEIIVGDDAKEMQAMGDNNIACFFKRNMGDENFVLEFNDKYYNAEDLSVIVLKKLKKDVENILKAEVKDAVITVPAYFNNLQRQSTINAGTRAGFNVLSILNEPTAAAMAYGMKKEGQNKNILVYDLGGGTFDVTLVHIEDDIIKVLSTDGDHELGGKDWDDRIAMYIGEKFFEKFGVNPMDDIEYYNDILVKCENVKKHLSKRESTEISIYYCDLSEKFTITKDIFVGLTGDLLQRTKSLSEDVLKSAGLTWDNIDGVLPVGGSTRMPMVLDFIREVSKKEPIVGINVDEVVSIGAAIKATIETSPKVTINKEEKSLFTLGGYKKTEDVMSHSLGMVALDSLGKGYINSIIIEKNKKIPCTEKRPYEIRTGKNRDNVLEVYMLQGESEEIENCTVLGKYVFHDISYVGRKPAVIDIEYSYNKNGVVDVFATQRETGKKLPLKIEKIPEDFSFEEGFGKTEEVVHKNIVIAMDLSGSMRGKPLEKAMEASKTFIEALDEENSSVGLIIFADRVQTLMPLTEKRDDIISAVEGLRKADVGTSTMSEPFSEAYDILKDAYGDCFIVVLTDGQWYGKKDIMAEVNKCKEDGIEIAAIGFGNARKDFLDKIATCEENSIFTEVSNLKQSFSRIAKVILKSESGIKMFQKSNSIKLQ